MSIRVEWRCECGKIEEPAVPPALLEPAADDRDNCDMLGKCGPVLVVNTVQCPNAQPNGEHLPTRQMNCTKCVNGFVPASGSIVEVTKIIGNQAAEVEGVTGLVRFGPAILVPFNRTRKGTV